MVSWLIKSTKVANKKKLNKMKVSSKQEETKQCTIQGVVKLWRNSDFDCPECGGMALTNSTALEGYYYDGDSLKCPECSSEGRVSVDADELSAWDSWD